MEFIKNIAIIFLSIFLESLPFLLLGSFISSIIERFISDETMAKIIPKNVFWGSLVGIFLGFFLPACDCAVIPVAKRLIKKKVPLNVAVSFMLASPIINPVVLISTYMAFSKINMNIFYLRLTLGIGISLIAGVIMGLLFKNNVVKNCIEEYEEECSCHKDVVCHHNHIHQSGVLKTIKFILRHTLFDSFNVIKYLMYGALLSSFIQVMMPRQILLFFNSSKILSVIILMFFAYLLSLCSTSDSFIGKSLLSSFNAEAVTAYLLLGPMIDVKNTIVLLGHYKKKFVLYLIFIIFILVFALSFLSGVIL